MNYFITGGTGFIGKYLIAELLKRKQVGTVYVLDDGVHRARSIDELDQGWTGRVDVWQPAALAGMLTAHGDLGLPAAMTALIEDVRDYARRRYPLFCVIAQNGIEPVIDKVFALDDAVAAYEYMASAQHFGKIVIRIAE